MFRQPHTETVPLTQPRKREDMKGVFLPQAMLLAAEQISGNEDMFMTPEHVLLQFLKDPFTRLHLSTSGLDVDSIERCTRQHVNNLPKFAVTQRAVVSFAFRAIFARLVKKASEEKSKAVVLATVNCFSFLEAYIYEGAVRVEAKFVSPVAQLLMPNYNKILFPAYGDTAFADSSFS